MSVFDELEFQYNEIDQYYAKLEFEAGSHGLINEEKQYQQRRRINDQAYFLYMFSRLEDHIRVETAALIQRKQDSSLSWKVRTPWDILPKEPDSDDLSFKKRLSLLTEKGFGDFNLVSNYYEERNSIAHGGSFIKPISMPTVIINLKKLYIVLKS